MIKKNYGENERLGMCQMRGVEKCQGERGQHDAQSRSMAYDL